MDRHPNITCDEGVNLGLAWTAAALFGAVFFFVGHDFQVSAFEGYAPWSDSDGSLESGGNVVKGLTLSLIGIFGLYLLRRRDGRPLRLTGRLPALMVFYLAWSAASVLWSDDPGLSCRKLAALSFCLPAALGLARQVRLRDLAPIAVAVPAAYLLAGIAAEIALGTFRPFSAGYRFSGTIHPNTQGVNLTVLCLGAFCSARFSSRGKSRRRLYWALFAIGLVFLLLTKSRTSCAALIASLGALWLMSVSGRTRLLAVFAAGFAVSSAALFTSLFELEIGETASDIALLGRREESAKLTGRIPIWKELSAYVAARPLRGYGYEAFWTDGHIEKISDRLQWPLREAHNAYLDSILGVGLIGAMALVSAIALALCRAAVAFRSTADAGAALIFCLLVLIVFNAFLETGLFSPDFVTLLAGCGVIQLPASVDARSRDPRGSGLLRALFDNHVHRHPHLPGAANGRGFIK
ncbi:MAG: O-antigen ligase family protein [Pirellulales bacterium]|nr:O-antigen ligase family protein [Pirellulales bacterium]